jgi:CheY-like chemotaxis protein
MSDQSSGAGRDFLARKTGATMARQTLAAPDDILIVDDNTFDADTVVAILHVLFGYDIDIRRAKTLGSAIDCVLAKKPSLVILDDILPPSDTAADTIPYLRGTGYTGPIVVVSGGVSRRRRVELIAAGASDVVHKDDLDSVRLSEALQRVLTRKTI